MLFCAAQAPELFGRDQRYGVLPLYFSRALTRIGLRARADRRADGRAPASSSSCPQVHPVRRSRPRRERSGDRARRTRSAAVPRFVAQALLTAGAPRRALRPSSPRGRRGGPTHGRRSSRSSIIPPVIVALVDIADRGSDVGPAPRPVQPERRPRRRQRLDLRARSRTTRSSPRRPARTGLRRRRGHRHRRSRSA